MRHPDPLVLTALAAADAAARVQQRWLGRIRAEAADLKGRGDFVTRADVEAQGAALDVIRRSYPGHGVLAEEDEPAAGEAEEAGTGSDSGPVWIVDPIDGTTNFLHGHPMHCASVAVAEAGRPVAGAVVCPPTGERWWARRGAGAFKNGRPIRVSEAQELEMCLLATGFPFKVLDRLPTYLPQLGRMLEAGAGVRRGGSAALDLCYLAEGRFDGFWELFLNPWDFAAGALLVEEAGGVVTGLDGGELALAPGSVLAANGSPLLERLLGLLLATQAESDPPTGAGG